MQYISNGLSCLLDQDSGLHRDNITAKVRKSSRNEEPSLYWRLKSTPDQFLENLTLGGEIVLHRGLLSIEL